jgi:hypothetical protein
VIVLVLYVPGTGTGTQVIRPKKKRKEIMNISFHPVNKTHRTMATAARKEPVKVFLRLRPFSELEETSGCSSAARTISQTRVSIKDDSVGQYQTEFDAVSD